MSRLQLDHRRANRNQLPTKIFISDDLDQEHWSEIISDPYDDNYNHLDGYDVILVHSITEIGDEAFRNFYMIKSIVVPSKVTRIGQDAFNVCECLESLQTIGFGAFHDCCNL